MICILLIFQISLVKNNSTSRFVSLIKARWQFCRAEFVAVNWNYACKLVRFIFHSVGPQKSPV